MINFLKKYFNRKNEVDDLLIELHKKTSNIIDLYNLKYSEIKFRDFHRLNVGEEVEIRQGVLMTVLSKTDTKIELLVKYNKNSFVDFHKHSDSVETFIHLSGKIVIIKYKSGDKENEERIVLEEKGSKVSFSPNEFHKMVVISDSIDYIELKTFDINRIKKAIKNK